MFKTSHVSDYSRKRLFHYKCYRLLFSFKLGTNAVYSADLFRIVFIYDDILPAQFPVKLEPCSAKLKNKGPLIVLKFENILHNMKLSFPCLRNTLTD